MRPQKGTIRIGDVDLDAAYASTWWARAFRISSERLRQLRRKDATMKASMRTGM